MVSIAFPGAITSFDLVVNRAAKLTQSRASSDHTMAIATFRYELRDSYRDCCQYKKIRTSVLILGKPSTLLSSRSTQSPCCNRVTFLTDCLVGKRMAEAEDFVRMASA